MYDAIDRVTGLYLDVVHIILIIHLICIFFLQNLYTRLAVVRFGLVVATFGYFAFKNGAQLRADNLVKDHHGLLNENAYNLSATLYSLVIWLGLGTAFAVPYMHSNFALTRFEVASGIQNVLSSWFALLVLDVATACIQASAIGLVMYFMLDIQGSALSFFSALFLIIMAGDSLAAACAAWSPTREAAALLFAVVAGISALFAGYVQLLSDLRGVWRWCARVVFTRWAFESLSISAFHNAPHGDHYLRFYGFGDGSSALMSNCWLLVWVIALQSVILAALAPPVNRLKVARRKLSFRSGGHRARSTASMDELEDEVIDFKSTHMAVATVPDSADAGGKTLYARMTTAGISKLWSPARRTSLPVESEHGLDAEGAAVAATSAVDQQGAGASSPEKGFRRISSGVPTLSSYISQDQQDATQQQFNPMRQSYNAHVHEQELEAAEASTALPKDAAYRPIGGAAYATTSPTAAASPMASKVVPKMIPLIPSHRTSISFSRLKFIQEKMGTSLMDTRISGVYGNLEPGTFTCIIDGAQDGSSTVLLQVLAGKTRALGKTSGTISANGTKLGRNTRYTNAAYVQAGDVCNASSLTVHQVLYYAALLRCVPASTPVQVPPPQSQTHGGVGDEDCASIDSTSTSTSSGAQSLSQTLTAPSTVGNYADVEQRVDEVLKLTGLAAIAHCKVGSDANDKEAAKRQRVKNRNGKYGANKGIRDVLADHTTPSNCAFLGYMCEKTQGLIQQCGDCICCNCTASHGTAVNDATLTPAQLRCLTIAVEIVNRPGLIFLEDPFGGLEWHDAEQIAQVLQSLARGGRTVVCSVPRPWQRLMSIATDVMLLGSGLLIYSGKANAVGEYFENIGEIVVRKFIFSQLLLFE